MRRTGINRIAFVVILAVVFILWPRVPAEGVTALRDDGAARTPGEDRARLTEGFRQVLGFFADREFSLLAAWAEMRESEDPRFFEQRYPSISQELDSWAATLERRFGGSGGSREPVDFTFLLEEFGRVAMDAEASPVMRDNALATVCMVCVMDDLRCDAGLFHRFLAAVVADDSSARRKAEALRWWRRSGGFIDEGLLASTLGSEAGRSPDLRAEAARILFSIATRRSLEAQRRLASTAGLPPDPGGAQSAIACTAIGHFARARYEAAMPDILAALEDPSRDVRACASESIAAISGRSFLFDPDDEKAPGNAEAIARWRAWWKGRSSMPSGSGR